MRNAFLAALLTLLGNKLGAADLPHSSAQVDASVESNSVFGGHEWLHGASDCSANSDPAIDVLAFHQTTYILRQNKCSTYEAPFIYVLIGRRKALVLDTGAIEDHSVSPVYGTISAILGQKTIRAKEILVIHSHSHRDHYLGDAQFEGKPDVTLVAPNGNDVKRFFAFSEWPEGESRIELGGRSIIVIPTPGHQEEAIALYDPSTRWLLTGDTLYPGYIYVKNWEDYKKSIARLSAFIESNDVRAILGSHIEMTSEPGRYYPIGTTFQPDEAALDLRPRSLQELNHRLQASTEKKELVFDGYIVAPMNVMQRTLSNIARWISQ